MLLTEQEAKTKQCRAAPPMVGPPSALAPGGPPQISFLPCVGRNCLMWREGAALRKEVERRAIASQTETRPDGFHSFMSAGIIGEDGKHQSGGYWIRFEFTARGYCGLAGRPDAPD